MNQAQSSAIPDDAELAGSAVRLDPSKRLGAYAIMDRIGKGAMGSVYRGVHGMLGRSVALKVMDAALLGDPEARQRFLREARVAASIRHPNVVDLLDVGVESDMPYLVMELLEGQDLEHYLAAQGPLTELEVAALATSVSAGLGAAHDLGIVHRDLKPSNIFLAVAPDGQVLPKVLDFGVSKRLTDPDAIDLKTTPFHHLIGSPLYLPPEAMRDNQRLTTRSDQYSLGVVLYECLTGRPPFAGLTLLDLLTAISNGDFPPPDRVARGVSPVVRSVILRAMSRDPAQRFDDVRALGKALQDAVKSRARRERQPLFGRLARAPHPAAGEPTAGAPNATPPVAALPVAALPVAALPVAAARAVVWQAAALLPLAAAFPAAAQRAALAAFATARRWRSSPRRRRIVLATASVIGLALAGALIARDRSSSGARRAVGETPHTARGQRGHAPPAAPATAASRATVAARASSSSAITAEAAAGTPATASASSTPGAKPANTALAPTPGASAASASKDRAEPRRPGAAPRATPAPRPRRAPAARKESSASPPPRTRRRTPATRPAATRPAATPPAATPPPANPSPPPPRDIGPNDSPILD